MIGEIFGYGVTVLSAVAAVFFGIKQAASQDRNGVVAQLKDAEDRKEKSDKENQMFKRRELTHERRESILIDALNDAEVAVPALPEFPEAWTS